MERLLPRAWWPRYFQLRQYSFGLLLLIVLLRPSALSGFFDSAERLWERLL